MYYLYILKEFPTLSRRSSTEARKNELLRLKKVTALVWALLSSSTCHLHIAMRPNHQKADDLQSGNESKQRFQIILALFRS